MLFKCCSWRLLTLMMISTLLVFSAGTLLASEWVVKGSKATGVELCVNADTNDMRRNHMDYLLHDRDRTVHLGDRKVVYTLSGCVNCHAAKDAAGVDLPINGHDAEGKPQFCAGCHEYVGVSMDCFQCHRKIAEEN